MMKGSLAAYFHTVNTLRGPIRSMEWLSAHSARARVGLRGSPVGAKVVKNAFFQSCYTTWGAQTTGILTHGGPILAHAISLKWAILGQTLQYKGA